ncbi:MAG: Maf family protein [Neomegalonema sp.]|nr:Maf family protein [Neomegalonema sp.]
MKRSATNRSLRTKAAQVFHNGEIENLTGEHAFPPLQLKALTLASGSAIRRRLLENAGIRVTARPARLDETALIATSRAARPDMLALELAQAKAQTVSALEDGLIIGGDQLLVLDGEVLQKAASIEAAYERLRRMQGRTHALVGATVLVDRGKLLWSDAHRVSVTMRAMSDSALRAYLAAVGPGVLASVACYEIEALGAQLIERLDGDYFSALGLPLMSLIGALQEHGALAR